MADRICEDCGTSFWQGVGRAARRCPPCRADDRYGTEHRQLRADTVASAYGTPCARCRKVMVGGEAIQLDHADNGDPSAYVGYSHASCNASAGAARGNSMRAAVYRAVKAGAIGVPAASGSRTVPARQPPSCQRSREEITAEAQTTGHGLPCLCGRVTSRCW
jgi:hypothetical protein